MAKNFPEIHQHLEGLIARLGKAAPATMAGFGSLHNSALADGALSTRTKELISLAIAIAIRCEGCVAYHVHDALRAGAAHDEVVETIGVAVLMGGGPAVVYGAEALEALEQFEAAGTP